MSEHQFTEGAIRNGNTYRYCNHCDLMLFFYKDSKLAQIKRDTDRAYYAEMARQHDSE
jgi:hypothetical protein